MINSQSSHLTWPITEFVTAEQPLHFLTSRIPFWILLCYWLVNLSLLCQLFIFPQSTHWSAPGHTLSLSIYTHFLNDHILSFGFKFHLTLMIHKFLSWLRSLPGSPDSYLNAYLAHCLMIRHFKLNTSKINSSWPPLPSPTNPKSVLPTGFLLNKYNSNQKYLGQKFLIILVSFLFLNWLLFSVVVSLYSLNSAAGKSF